MLSTTAIATIMNANDAIAVEPAPEKYPTLGDVAINAAKASAPARPSTGRSANATAIISNAHSVTTIREVASDAPIDAKIEPWRIVTHETSDNANAARPCCATRYAAIASRACGKSSGRAPRAIVRMISA